MKRRQLLQGFLAVSAAGLLPGCTQAPKTTNTPLLVNAGKFLDEIEMTLLSNVADALIPKTDTEGALGAGVPLVLDIGLADFSDTEEQNVWRSGLKALNLRLVDEDNNQFHQLANEAREDKLDDLDSDAFGAWYSLDFLSLGDKGDEGDGEELIFYRTLKATIVKAYYMSKVGATEELRYESIPGRWQPCIPYEDGDRAWFDFLG